MDKTRWESRHKYRMNEVARMKKSLDQNARAQLFIEARTYNNFLDEEVPDAVIHELYDLMKWGPTAVNGQPARFVFIRSKAAKERLKTALNPGNVDKTMAAPLTVVVAYDSRFFDHLPQQWTAYDARPAFADNPDLAAVTAFRNGSLGGAYLMMAARLLGLDCGPMSGFDNARLDAEFFPDGRFKSNFIVNMGRGREGGFYPRGPRLAFDEAVQIL